MENPGPTHKSDPAGTNPDGNTRAPIIRADSGETERPPSVQRVNPDANKSPNCTDDEEELDEEPDPGNKIVDFDWEDLHERYHRAINTASAEEAELMSEWSELMEVCCLYSPHG